MQAAIFPGQGAQYPGMGRSLYDNNPEAREIFSRIDNALGYKLSDKCFYGSPEELKDTSLQQLAILAVSIAAFEAFKKKSVCLSYLSGLSLGEYSCLYAAGVLSLEEIAILVRERGLAMQEAASTNPSTMFAVINGERKQLEARSSEGGFYLANVNSPGQIVVSLKVEDRDKAKGVLDGLGTRVIELEVSGGFHSPFMQSAGVRLRNAIDKLNFNDAQIPIISNVTAKGHTDKEEIKDNLVKQLTSPVLWNDCVEHMITAGIDLFYELGPSRILRALMRKINPKVKVINIEKQEYL